MQTQNRLFDDLARVAGGAFGALVGIRNEIEEMIKQRLERLLADLDHVPREEFEAVRAMAEKARIEQEAMASRIAALEAALADAQKPRAKAKPKPAKDTESSGDAV